MKRAPKVDAEALLCALVLAPGSFSRNRFFRLFEDPKMLRTRRRAARVRGILRQLLGEGRTRKAELTGEHVLEDGRVLIRYKIPSLDLQRTSALSQLEASVLRYALHRAGQGEISKDDRQRVEKALAQLSVELELPPLIPQDS